MCRGGRTSQRHLDLRGAPAHPLVDECHHLVSGVDELVLELDRLPCAEPLAPELRDAGRAVVHAADVEDLRVGGVPHDVRVQEVRAPPVLRARRPRSPRADAPRSPAASLLPQPRGFDGLGLGAEEGRPPEAPVANLRGVPDVPVVGDAAPVPRPSARTRDTTHRPGRASPRSGGSSRGTPRAGRPTICACPRARGRCPPPPAPATCTRHRGRSSPGTRRGRASGRPRRSSGRRPRSPATSRPSIALCAALARLAQSGDTRQMATGTDVDRLRGLYDIDWTSVGPRQNGLAAAAEVMAPDVKAQISPEVGDRVLDGVGDFATFVQGLEEDFSEFRYVAEDVSGDRAWRIRGHRRDPCSRSPEQHASELALPARVDLPRRQRPARGGGAGLAA